MLYILNLHIYEFCKYTIHVKCLLFMFVLKTKRYKNRVTHVCNFKLKKRYECGRIVSCVFKSAFSNIRNA